MNLSIQKMKGNEYVYLRESFWDSERKKYSSRIIKSFGRLDKLLEENPNALDELRKLADAHKENHEKQKRVQINDRIKKFREESKNIPLKSKQARLMRVGSCIYRQIWNKLCIQRKLKDIQQEGNTLFDFPNASFFMVAGRILMPDSKLSQWKSRNQYLYGADKLQTHHLYRSIDLLSKNKENIVIYLNKQIAKKYKRIASVALYDVTTYYFESQKSDKLRDFGFSKDNKVNQVQVVLGLLVDDKGIPVDYELYPGNTSEINTMIPILKKLKSLYGIERVTIVADRGLNSRANLLAIKELGMDYVVAYRLKGAGKAKKDLITEEDGWFTLTSNGDADLFRYKISTETRTVKYDNKRINITSNLLIGYSFKRALKDEKDRDRLVRKAEKYVEDKTQLNGDMRRGGKNYLKIDIKGIPVELDNDRILNDKFYDGYFGIVYSDNKMTPEEVLDSYHSLWKIEESFRISKSILEARPCFHWTEKRIRGHFMICYMALVLQRLLEQELKNNNIKLSTQQITKILSEATLTEGPQENGKLLYYLAFEDEININDFYKIESAVGLEKLSPISTAAEVKSTFHLKSL